MKIENLKRPLSDSAQDVISYIKSNLSNYENQWFALNQAAIVAITDFKGKIQHVNDTFCEISKYSEEELVGEDHSILNSGYHDKFFFLDLWQTILNGDVWRGEIKNKAKDGTYYWVQTTIVPFFDDLGKITQFISIRFNITSQKNLELSLDEKVKQRTKELSKLNDEQQIIMTRLNKQNAYLEQILGIMSHDLRSPVASIQGLTYLIDKSGLNDKAKMLMSKIDIVAEQMGNSIEEIMEVSMILQEEKMDLQPMRIEDSFFKAKSDLTGLILQTDAQVTYDFSQCQEITYKKSYMDSIMLNLLSNAIKYRKKDEEAVIHVSTTKNNDGVTLLVKDNGLGLDLNKVGHKIFGLQQTFHNLNNSRGYGLYLIKTQVDVMGGSISVDSQVGVGSTFKLDLGKV